MTEDPRVALVRWCDVILGLPTVSAETRAWWFTLREMAKVRLEMDATP